jgi:hypothetical protein
MGSDILPCRNCENAFIFGSSDADDFIHFCSASCETEWGDELLPEEDEPEEEE